MHKTVIYELGSLYRDNFRVTGYTFGEGEKSVCVVGSTRGNEIQQIYTCSRLIQTLKQLEMEEMIVPGKQIMVIPSCNPYSMNIKKRFWPTDNTDINRMFPGYDLGETTQRIAGGIFEAIQGYRHGIQLTSFYMQGDFVPHVRMMTTGLESPELAKEFGLPYVVLRQTRPYDTTTLNYNWQIWESHAYSLYTTGTERIDIPGAQEGVDAMLRYMAGQGILKGTEAEEGAAGDTFTEKAAAEPRVISDQELKSARVHTAGLFEALARPGDRVGKGQILARVLDPYDGELREEVRAKGDGIVFFAYHEPMTYANTAVFKMILFD